VQADLFGALLREATEDCMRGQTGLGRKPALEVGWVRASWVAKPVTWRGYSENDVGPADASLDSLGRRARYSQGAGSKGRVAATTVASGFA